MTKRLILHPFLFALFPLSTLLLNNLAILAPLSLLRSALIVQLAALLLWGLLRRFFRNAQASAVAVSILLFFFFLNRQWGEYGMPILWSVLAVGLTFTGRRKPLWLAGLSPALNTMAIVILLLQAVQCAQAFRPANIEPVTVRIPVNPDSKGLPHIVHIVLDGFGRIDTLQRQFGCDVRCLQQHLESKGFFVATNATANYLKTMHSMGSALAMDYLPGTSATGLTRQAMLSRPQLDRLVEDSPVKQLLARMGYTCKGSVLSEVLLRQWNTPSGIGLGLTFAEKTLLQRTAAYPFLRDDASLRKGYGPLHDALLQEHYARVRSEFEDTMAELAGPDPVFKIVHILSPHPPFVFLADGSPQPYWQTDDFLFSDGDHFLRNDEAWSNYREGYAEQAQYAAREACSLVDRILAASARPVVVIILGDHGSGLDFSFESSKGNLDCRSSILMAIKLPGHTPPLPDEFQSPVNLYRHLFRELWTTDILLLPTRIFYSGWTSPEVYEDVTARVDTQRRAWIFQETEEHRTVEAFLRTTAATWNRMASAGWVYYDQVRHCPWDASTVSNAALAVAGAPDAGPALNDEDLGTKWTTVFPSGETTQVNVALPEPVTVCGLRLISMDRDWPGIRKIEVETDQGPVLVLTNWVPTAFAWSGPDLYERELTPHREVFFTPRTARSIRVEFSAASDNGRVALNELECLAPAPWPTEWRKEDLLAAVKQRGAGQVYAPRWIERSVHEQRGRQVSVNLPAPYLRQSACHYWRDGSTSLSPVRLTRDTVLVGYRSDVAPSQAAFRRAAVEPYSEVMGDFVLYWFDARNWKEEYGHGAALHAIDGRVRCDGDRLKTKRLARFFHEQAQKPGVTVPQQIEWLSRCVNSYPNYQPAWLQLSGLQKGAGNEEAAGSARREWQARAVPATRCEASFAQSAILLGYTLPTNRMAAGARNTLALYWRVPTALNPKSLAVFLHFRQGQLQFQGDRVFLDRWPAFVTQDQPFQEVFRQDMPFETPADALSGPYEISLGLCDRASGQRLKVKSEYETRKQCIKLPSTLTVEGLQPRAGEVRVDRE